MRSVIVKYLSVFQAVVFSLTKLLARPQGWAAIWRAHKALLSSAKSGSTFRISWSQDGEDLFLADFLPKGGFFVDVGAHHPHRFSVTQLLSDRGWVGLNIDVTNAILTDFPKFRPLDQHHFGLAGNQRLATFYRFEEPALNTLDAARAQQLVKEGWVPHSEEVLEVTPLSEILEQYSSPKTINLLSCDAEGADLEILQSMDWDTYDVQVLLVETPERPWQFSESALVAFVESKGFRLVGAFLRSTIFEKAN